MPGRPDEPRFLVDRMLGTLTRYLRFMGYDTESAHSLRPGNTREDSILLGLAESEGRLLLTRDRELARRGGRCAIYIHENNVLGQIRQLADSKLIEPSLRMTRCSLCNEPLRPATRDQVMKTGYAPEKRDHLSFYWCRMCRKLYWIGSHGKDLEKRLGELDKD